MFGLIAAGAAILLGGAWVLCKTLEANNRAKRKRLERAQERAERDVRRATEDIARAERERVRQVRRRALSKALKTATDEEAIAVRHWKEIKAALGSLVEQTVAVYRRRDELKRQRGKRKTSLIAAAKGRFVDIRADATCAMLLAQIRELGLFWRSLVNDQNAMIENKHRIFAVMRSCNEKGAAARMRLFDFESEGRRLRYCRKG